MQLVWINKNAGTKNSKPAGSHLIRHARRTRTYGQGHIKLFDNHAVSNFPVLSKSLTPRGGTRCASSRQRAYDEEKVAQTEDGSTFFLITRQQDFPAKAVLPSPRPSIDSLCSPAAILRSDYKVVIRYISNEWLPKTNHIQPNRFFGSFSLVWPGDDKYADAFLISALQSSDARSLYSLLAVGARKMRLSGAIMPYETSAAEVLMLKAIKALRRSIAGKYRPNDQLVLDLTFLVLAELYARSPQHIVGVDVYWHMMQEYIISMGGVAKMRPVVVCFVMSIDALCAFTGISLPNLDVRRVPQLLGGEPMATAPVGADDSKHALMEESLTSILTQLDLRSQVIIETIHTVTQLMGAIQDLPVPALSDFRTYLQQYLPLAVNNISTPLCPYCPPAISFSTDTLTCTTADVAHSFARLYGNAMWWWYGACHFLPDEDTSIVITPPPVVDLAVSQAWRFIDKVDSLLRDKTWYVTSDMVLWIGALGYLVARKDGAGRLEYRRLFVRTAREKKITDEVKLAKTLMRFLSLAIIDTDYLRHLWHLLESAPLIKSEHV